jgi:hypothetical protein
MTTSGESWCPTAMIRFFRNPAVGWTALTALFFALLAMSWRRWPDPLVDFGRELYIPWRMNQGALLFRDIEHIYGPLSQHLNAALFRVFAPNFTTIVVANVFFSALLAVLLYRIAFLAAGRGVAFLSTLIYVAVFAFGNYTRISNYNFICPFSHEATHGLILCLASLHAWQLAFRRQSLKSIAFAGVFTGLGFLTRAETFVASLFLALGAFGFWAVARPRLGRKWTVGVFFFSLAFAFPIVGWYVFSLLRTGDAAGALRNTISAWDALIRSGALALPFYRGLMGTDHLGANLMAMVVECAGVLLSAVLVVYLGVRLGNRPKRGSILVIILFVFMAFGPTQWMNTGRSIPLLVAAVLAWNVGRVWRNRQMSETNHQPVQFALWATLSLALLVKIFAHAQLFHYGFYLALPSSLLLTAAAMVGSGDACAAMAHRLHRPLHAASSAIVAGAIVAFVIAFAGQCLWISLGNYSYRTLAVGVGANRIFTLPPRLDDRGPAINMFLDWSKQHMEPGATFAVLPEGVSLNFLSGHPSSVRYVNFLPFEFAAFGEREILSEFQAHPPDYIVLADRNVTEYGVERFGVEGYGAEILRWIEQAYDPVFRIGPPPFSGQGFGIEVLKHQSGRGNILAGSYDPPLTDHTAKRRRWEMGNGRCRGG